jgi:O-antigen/teichoic acid export membrane protein
LFNRFLKKIEFSSNLINIFRLASANIVASIIGLSGTFIQARFISPQELGYFKGFEVATGYAFFLHLGIFGAFQRNYSFYVGRGDISKAEDYAKLSYSWNLLISVIVGGLFMLIAAFYFIKGNWQAGMALIVQCFAIVNYFYGGHFSVLFNSTHNFKVLSKYTNINSFVSIISFPFYYLWPYFAMSLRASVGSIFGIIFLHKNNSLRHKYELKFRNIFNLMREGFPMFTASYGAGIGWDTLEKSLILFFIGQNGLGLWSFGFMFITMLKMVPQAINSVFIPQIMQFYGNTLDPKATLKYCYKPMKWGIPLIVLSIIGVVLFLPSVIQLTMPKYIEAIPIISLMLFVLPLDVIGLPYAVMIARGNVLHQNISTFVSLSLFLLLSLFSIYLGFGIYGIIFSSIICRIIKLFIIFLYLKRYISEFNYEK